LREKNSISTLVIKVYNQKFSDKKAARISANQILRRKIKFVFAISGPVNFWEKTKMGVDRTSIAMSERICSGITCAQTE